MIVFMVCQRAGKSRKSVVLKMAIMSAKQEVCQEAMCDSLRVS